MVVGECSRASRNFHGNIAFRRAEELALTRISSVLEFVRADRHIRQTHQDFFVGLLQLSGTGLLSQDGRNAFLRPGDFTFIDSTRPSNFKLGSASLINSSFMFRIGLWRCTSGERRS